MPDSLLTDTTAVRVTAVALHPAADSVLLMPRTAEAKPFDTSLDHALSAAVEKEPLDMSLFKNIIAEADAPPAWTSGHEPAPRIIHPAGHSAVLAALSLLFIACLIAYSRYGRALTSSVKDLWSLRQRQNAFDEGSPGRRRVQFLLALQFATYSGVLLYAAMCPVSAPDAASSLADIFRFIVLASAFYIFQLTAYAAVGYTFAPDASAARQWLDGFNASQGLAGIALALPTLGLVFYPDASAVMLAMAATIYVIARLIFITKGFRIFYTGVSSLVYFILYLCTLEIVPVICVCGIADAIVSRT